MLNKLLASAALAVLPLVPAQAGQPLVKVGYSDLDLSHPQGRATLDRRLVKASARVCQSSIASNAGLADEIRCRRVTVAMARQKADRVILALQAQGLEIASK